MPYKSNNLLIVFFFFQLLFRYDIKVSLKKKYNDAYKSSKGFLSGNEWYCHQAFRALNQAAGICPTFSFNLSKWDFSSHICAWEKFHYIISSCADFFITTLI